MEVDLRQLLAGLVESGKARTPLSRFTFLGRVASEEELAQFFTDLLVKAAEAKHADRWDDLTAHLEAWEDWTLARLAASAEFPDLVVPWTPFRAPLDRAKIALMTSGGLYLDGQEPFVLTNDATYREIPRGTQQEAIRVAHRGYDISGPLRDMNCMLPLRRFEELEHEGVIGNLAETNYSFNGSIPDVRFLEEWPHEAARTMREEGVDAVFLTPA